MNENSPRAQMYLRRLWGSQPFSFCETPLTAAPICHFFLTPARQMARPKKDPRA